MIDNNSQYSTAKYTRPKLIDSDKKRILAKQLQSQKENINNVTLIQQNIFNVQTKKRGNPLPNSENKKLKLKIEIIKKEHLIDKEKLKKQDLDLNQLKDKVFLLERDLKESQNTQMHQTLLLEQSEQELCERNKEVSEKDKRIEDLENRLLKMIREKTTILEEIN